MPSDRDFFLIGVTGGIGSGKTVVCEGFQSLGRTVLSADNLAREIMDTEDEVKQKVRQLFGTAAYSPEGLLDRRFVAARVFGESLVKKKLDAIVHPAVFREIEVRISRLSAEQRFPYVVIEAALIYESGFDKRLDYVIVVQAAKESRIRRVTERDGSTRAEVLRRIASQLSQEELVKRADFLIRNDSDLSQIPSKVRFIDQLLSRMAKPTTFSTTDKK